MSTDVHPAFAKFKELKDTLPSDAADDADVRESLLREARKLMLSLERPDNVVERVCFQVWEPIVIQVGEDIGLFKYLDAGCQPRTTQELAKLTHTDPLLLSRILRCLAAFGAIDEVDVDTYSSTNVSTTFAQKINQNALEACLGFLTPGWIAVPKLLQSKGYKNPTDPNTTAVALAYGHPEGESAWNLLKASPHVQAFYSYMGTFNEGHKDWRDIYPLEERIIKGAKTDEDHAVMVDVGGGHGYQAIGVRERFPDAPGRFIVQDLAQALPKESHSGVEFLEHDFLQEQPIKGARLYYLRYVPHDWSQEVVTKLVTRLREAMTPGYSRLVVNEWILPKKGVSTFMAVQDLNMMATGGGMERTEDLHREYLEAAGLTVTGIWGPGDQISESVIEAQLL